MRIAIRIWKQTLVVFKKNPEVLVPFAGMGILNTAVLYLLYLAPQRPVSIVLAPPIRVFWGEKFLHYPFNFFLLPKLFYYANITIDALIGVLLAGLAIGMLKDIYSGEPPKMFADFAVSIKRYFALLSIWIITFCFSLFAMKIFKSLFSGMSGSLMFSFLTYLFLIFIQVLFVYSMAAIIVEKRSVFSAIKVNFLFLKQFFFTTLILVFIPALFYLPVLVLKNKLGAIIRESFPEIVIFVLGFSILGMLIVNMLIIVPPTILFLEKRRD